ncbi:MAG: tetratricopeptide repeat protein [Desulfovibrio sp.]|jgi:Flp pilus assembly protein TadD|nr:tetratricopeptide repeat protein [Desulfovibrio sp.]
MNRPVSFTVIFAALCIVAALTAMSTTFLFKTKPSLIKETINRGIAETQQNQAPSPPDGKILALPAEKESPAVSEEQAGELMDLMRKLQTAPNDADVLYRIGDIFIASQDWRRAEVFLNRATLSRPQDIKPRYLLGISQYQQNKFVAAAQSFEELISLKEDPAAMYNLAIIYKYHIGKNTEAEALLRKVISSSEADADTVSKAKTEL